MRSTWQAGSLLQDGRFKLVEKQNYGKSDKFGAQGHSLTRAIVGRDGPSAVHIYNQGCM
jgi:hypothetical protein